MPWLAPCVAILLLLVVMTACSPTRPAAKTSKESAPDKTTPAVSLNAVSPLDLTPQAEFGNRLQLVAVHMDKSALVTGEPLTVRLEWRSLAPIDGDLRAFISLIDEEGEEVAGDDDVIGTRENPTSGWAPGATGVHNPRATLPSRAQPKTITIRAGVLETDRLTRLPVTHTAGLEAGDDWVTIARFGADDSSAER